MNTPFQVPQGKTVVVMDLKGNHVGRFSSGTALPDMLPCPNAGNPHSFPDGSYFPIASYAQSIWGGHIPNPSRIQCDSQVTIKGQRQGRCQDGYIIEII